MTTRADVFPPGLKRPTCEMPKAQAHFRCVCGSVAAFHYDAAHEVQAHSIGGSLVGGVFRCCPDCLRGRERPTPAPQMQSRCAHCRCVVQYPVGSPPAGSIAIDQWTWFCGATCHRAATTPPAEPVLESLADLEALEARDPAGHRRAVNRILAAVIGGAR